MATDISIHIHFGFWPHKYTCSCFKESHQCSYTDTILQWLTGLEERHVLWWDVTLAKCQYHLHILKFRLKNARLLFVLLSRRHTAKHNVILKSHTMPYIALFFCVFYLCLLVVSAVYNCEKSYSWAITSGLCVFHCTKSAFHSNPAHGCRLISE